jgi:tetratricopeptide (TPR) repeat protein
VVKQIKIIFAWIVGRVGFFHIIIFLFVLIAVDGVRLKSKMASFYAPESAIYLSNLSKGIEKVDVQQLKQFQKYYGVIDRYLGSSPFTKGSKAYVDYNLGDIVKARKNYLKALKIYPYYSNYYYNLALIDFRRNDYKGMIDLLENALNVKNEKNFMFIYSSRSEMNEYLGRIDCSKEGLAIKFEIDYQDAAFLLIVVAIYMGSEDFAVRILEKLAQTKLVNDARYSCVQEYLRSSNTNGKRVGSAAFRQCQQELGWVDQKTGQPLEDDLFGINQIPLKLW